MENCKTTDGGLACVSVTGCWIRGLLMSKKFWLSFAGALVTILLFEWFWQGKVMMSAYYDTAVMWRPYKEMKSSLFLLSYALTAFAYTYLILASMRTSRWQDAIAAGFKLGLLWVATGIMEWNVMPFLDHNVPVRMAIGGFIEAILVAVVIKLINCGCAKYCCGKKDAAV